MCINDEIDIKIGEFKDGVLNGKGLKNAVDKDIYFIGEFKDGSYEEGVTITEEGNVFIGKQENLHLEGYCATIVKVSEINKDGWTTEIGEFKDGWLSEGVYLNSRGDNVFETAYIGKFSDDDLEGERIIEDGSRAIGDFKGGNLHGKAVLVQPEGDVMVAGYENGVLKGKLLIYTPDEPDEWKEVDAEKDVFDKK